MAKYTTYFLETFNNGIELIRFAKTILQFDTDGTEEDKKAFINERLIESYKNYEPELGKRCYPSAFSLQSVPEEFHPDIYNKINDSLMVIMGRIQIGYLKTLSSSLEELLFLFKLRYSDIDKILQWSLLV